MPRTFRFRSKSKSQSGTHDYFINSVRQPGHPITTTLSRSSSMSDWVGRPVAPSSLDATTWKQDGVSISGKTTYVSGSYTYEHKFDKYPLAVTTGSLLVEPLPAKSGWMLDLVAGTNPSRPVMTPPTLLQDLIDIPKQIFQLGKLFKKPRSQMSPKELANHYLCVQFGWLPLFEDVHQLLNLQSYILKRNKELRGLYEKGGLKRRIRFDSDTQVGIGSTSVPSGPSRTTTILYQTMVKRSSWGSIRWVPTIPPAYRMTDEELNKLSRRIVLGLTVEGMAKGIWDVIPWTWLLGWFTNVGKYTLAYSNTVPATHSDGCLMRMSEAFIRPSAVVPDAGVTANIALEGALIRKRMTRTVSTLATPGLNVPYLDTFRLSILSALFAQRAIK